MSKNIIIQNNGVSVTYTGAKKIKTRNAKGGTLYWLPEGEQPTAVKNITANGTYKASDENLYAYSQAIVNVPGAAKDSETGRDRTDGNDYNVTVDPQTDEIVKTKIPSGIIIATPPTKTTYTDGETINYSGMVVKTVDGNGNEIATVPSSAVITEVTVADSSKARAADDISPLPHLFYFGEGTQWSTHTYTYKASKNCSITSFYDPQTHNSIMVIASQTPATYDIYLGSHRINAGTPFTERTYNGQTFYIYGEVSQAEDFDPVYNEVSMPTLISDKTDAVAWAMLYGNRAEGTKMLLPIRVTNEYADDDLYAYQEITVS